MIVVEYEINGVTNKLTFDKEKLCLEFLNKLKEDHFALPYFYKVKEIMDYKAKEDFYRNGGYPYTSKENSMKNLVKYRNKADKLEYERRKYLKLNPELKETKLKVQIYSI